MLFYCKKLVLTVVKRCLLRLNKKQIKQIIKAATKITIVIPTVTERPSVSHLKSNIVHTKISIYFLIRIICK